MATISWFDEFLGVALWNDYSVATSGTGNIRLSANPSIGGWLALGAGPAGAGAAQLRYVTPADTGYDGLGWATFGEQRLLISTILNIDLTIGFVSIDNPANVAGALLYRADLGHWIFQTGADGQYTNIATDWLHTPGETFTVRVETGTGYSAAFIDGVEVARSTTNLPGDERVAWDTQVWNQAHASGYSAPTVWVDYLWVGHDNTSAPVIGPIDTAGWHDEFSSPTLAPQYWVSTAGSGAVGQASSGDWLELFASSTEAGTARIRLGEDPAVSPHDAMNWFPGLGAVGEQRVVVNTTQGLHLTIGWVSRDDPVNVGGALLYRADRQEWFFQTISNNDYNNVSTGFNHIPGVPFTVRIETGDGIAIAFIDGVEVARSEISVPSDLPYAWENQLWSFPDDTPDVSPALWIDYMRVEQDRGTVFNKPVSEDNWITGTRSGHLLNVSPTWQIVGVGDFNNDGTDDILLRSTFDGTVAVRWARDGFITNHSTLYPSAPTTWQIQGVGDFNGDGFDDIVLRSSIDGTVATWTIKDGRIAREAIVHRNTDPVWQLQGVGDFNGDGSSDLLLRSASSGTIVVWFMNHGSFAGQTVIHRNTDLTWQIVGVGNFNGDTYDDILLRSSASGTVVTWSINDGRFAGQKVVERNLGFDIGIPQIADVNGDGSDDLFLWDNRSNRLEVWMMQDGIAAGRNVLADEAGALWTLAAVGDFNGNGGSDVLWRNSLNAQVVSWDISSNARGIDAWDFFVV